MTMANTIRALLPDGTLPSAAEQQVRDISGQESAASSSLVNVQDSGASPAPEGFPGNVMPLRGERNAASAPITRNGVIMEPGEWIIWGWLEGRWERLSATGGTPPGGGGGGDDGSTAPPQDAYSQAVLEDYPTHYLPLTDIAGSTEAANFGSAGTPWPATSVEFGTPSIGGPGTSATLTGTSFLAAPGQTVMQGLTQWTVTLLVKRTDTGTGRLGVVGSARTDWSLATNAANIFGYLSSGFVGGSSGIVSGNYNEQFTPGTTAHLALVYTGTSIDMHVNGTHHYSAPASGATPESLPVQVGSLAGGNPALAGSYAGVALFPGVALSASRIQAHAEAAGVV